MGAREDALSRIHSGGLNVWELEERQEQWRWPERCGGEEGVGAPAAAAASPPSAPVLEKGEGKVVRRKESVPPIFVCPITQEFMRDPCIAEDGYTYEREAIERWAARSDRSPMSNQKMKTLRVIPNHALRSAISEWKMNHGNHAN